MDAIPQQVMILADEARFPEPDDKEDPDSKFSLTKHKAAKMGLLLDLLITYIEAQLEKCGNA